MKGSTDLGKLAIILMNKIKFVITHSKYFFIAFLLTIRRFHTYFLFDRQVFLSFSEVAIVKNPSDHLLSTNSQLGYMSTMYRICDVERLVLLLSAILGIPEFQLLCSQKLTKQCSQL